MDSKKRPLGCPATISGKVSKSVANRSTIAGRSMTRKSVAEGSPCGPRSAPSCVVEVVEEGCADSNGSSQAHWSSAGSRPRPCSRRRPLSRTRPKNSGDTWDKSVTTLSLRSCARAFGLSSSASSAVTTLRASTRKAYRTANGANPSATGVVVREGGLEPPHPCGRRHLKPVRLPIPPLARGVAKRAQGSVRNVVRLTQ